MLRRWIAHSEKRGEWHVVGSRGFSAIVSIHTCWTCNPSDHTIYPSIVDVCLEAHNNSKMSGVVCAIMCKVCSGTSSRP